MSQTSFIQKVITPCQNAVKKIGGYLPSVLIGQMCLQTGYGQGYNCEALMQWNNLLGMKTELLNDTWTSNYWDGRSATKRTPEYYGYHTTITDSFRVYDSIEQCACDYLQFMRDAKYSKNGSYKYRDVLTIKNPRTLITQVSQRGYATDPQYISSVMSIINKHNLTQYDNISQKEIKKDMTLREALSKLGVNLIDIIGQNRSQVPAHHANTHQYFAVHYLGVNGQNPYLYGGGYGGHFYVSKDGKCYQAAEVTDKLWHVGASSGYSYIHPNARNANTIGVECATYTASGRNNDSETWYFTEATQITAAKLAAAVLTVYNMPLDHLLRHGDITTKNCPSPLKRDAGKGTNWTWDQFKNKVSEYLNVLGNGGSISTILKVGSTGQDVTDLQKKLKVTGFVDCVYYDISNFVDGQFGANTEKSVKYLQEAAGITVDGIYGPKSEKALNEFYNKAKKSNLNFTVKTFLNNAKTIAKQNKTNNFIYGNAPCLPSVYPKAKMTSCDRYVDQVLYLSGMTDIGNRRIDGLVSYLKDHKAVKIDNKANLKAGDIVLSNNGGHVFILGNPKENNTYERYDSGSVDRIQLKNNYKNYTEQPFIEPIDDFYCAYRLPFAPEARTILKQGDSGNDVKDVQTKVIKCGYFCGDDGADGIYGQNTTKAIKLFQKDHDLDADGIYGPLTKAKLDNIYAKVKNFDKPQSHQAYAQKTLTTTANLNLRNGSSTAHEVLAVIPRGAQVKWYGYYTNAWNYVIYKDYVGYASSSYLK